MNLQPDLHERDRKIPNSKSKILIGKDQPFWILNLGFRILALIILFAALAPEKSFAQELTYRHKHHLFNINVSEQSHWKTLREIWVHNDAEIVPRAEWRVDGDDVPALPDGVFKRKVEDWNRGAIAVAIENQISNKLNREPGAVTIGRDGSGKITFDGIGFPGREVNLDQAVTLTIFALENGLDDVVLPVIETQPSITVEDPELRKNGIVEVLSMGESNYQGSPPNRRHNIANGVSKFNGHLVKQGDTFSFNNQLGVVNARTGYKKELVIQGSRTLPEYGGGLCQVSTTAYRGVWEYGFPIKARKNHSYAVVYYEPQGTDSTIYIPWTDLKFINDTPGDILIQTHTEGEKAYFIYYGTHDNRIAEIIGPYNWNEKPPPPKRTEFVSSLPPGAIRQVGSAVPGISVAWFRVITKDGVESEPDPFYSHYEARPNFYQVGIGTPSSKTADISTVTPLPRGERAVKLPTRRSRSFPTIKRPSRRTLRATLLNAD